MLNISQPKGQLHKMVKQIFFELNIINKPFSDYFSDISIAPICRKIRRTSKKTNILGLHICDNQEFICYESVRLQKLGWEIVAHFDYDCDW